MTREVRQRKCLVTAVVCSSSELIRFVCAPDGKIVPDVAAKLPGRGCWIKADRKVLAEAIDKKLLLRFGYQALSSKTKKDIEGLEAPQEQERVGRVSVPENLLEQIEDLLKKRCLDHLSLANRAGLVITGFEKVRSILKSGKSKILITASDGAVNGRSKMCQGLDSLQVIDIFSRADLSKATGQENAVNITVLAGGLRKSLLREISRYELTRKKVIN